MPVHGDPVQFHQEGGRTFAAQLVDFSVISGLWTLKINPPHANTWMARDARFSETPKPGCWTWLRPSVKDQSARIAALEALMESLTAPGK